MEPSWLHKGSATELADTRGRWRPVLWLVVTFGVGSLAWNALEALAGVESITLMTHFADADCIGNF